MAESLAAALPREQARVGVVLVCEGYATGLSIRMATGRRWPVYVAAFIEADLREADQAVMSGDVVRMLRAFEKLKGIEG